MVQTEKFLRQWERRDVIPIFQDTFSHVVVPYQMIQQHERPERREEEINFENSFSQNAIIISK